MRTYKPVIIIDDPLAPWHYHDCRRERLGRIAAFIIGLAVGLALSGGLAWAIGAWL